MTDINQNFSLFVRNDTEVLFDIGPDEAGTNLDFAEELTWTAYDHVLGVPNMTTARISKTVGAGITITDPLLMTFTVELMGTDTDGMAGNYYHEVKLVADHGKLVTLSTGLMTVIDPSVVPNVDAFKAMFPEFEDVDDSTVQIALDQAGQFVDSSWGASQTAGQIYLAAHFMSIAASTSDTSGQIVTSESIGRISISYATSSAAGGSNGGGLGSTGYGLVFRNMLTAQGFGIAVV